MNPPLPELALAVEQQVFAQDREWFERHPGRAYRLRRPVLGEINGFYIPPEVDPLVLVRRVIPGFHSRDVLGVTKGVCDSNCDWQLGTLWEHLAPAEIRPFVDERLADLLGKPDAEHDAD